MINWSEANDSELVCYCIEVDKKTIVDAIKNGNDTPEFLNFFIIESRIPNSWYLQRL